MSRPATDHTAALAKVRRLMERRGLSATAAAREVAEKMGTPSAASSLRARLAREGGRRAVTLTFSAEEWAAIEAVGGDDLAHLRAAMVATILKAAASRDPSISKTLHPRGPR